MSKNQSENSGTYVEIVVNCFLSKSETLSTLETDTELDMLHVFYTGHSEMIVLLDGGNVQIE